MRPTLKQLEALIWVADLGSFSRAANRLNTTQPNISARISSLETLLDITLMERDAGSVRLTAKGLEVLEHARKVLNATEVLVRSANSAALYDGTLRLGVTEMIVHTWLPEYLKQLKTMFPAIQVEMTVDMSVTLEKQLAERTIDLALQNGPFTLAASGERDLGTYDLIWVAAPDLDLPHRAPVAIEDLARHSILTHGRETRLYSQTLAHFSERRDLDVRLVPSSSLAVCLHMAVNGMGIMTVPCAMVQRELATGALIDIPYGWTPDSLQFFARFDGQKGLSYISTAADLAVTVAQRFAS
jgi:DNA-binding transcriptional LysR family regulator